MANQVNVVIEVADKVIRDVVCCSASVPDKLPLGHFVFDVGAGQVDGQQDQTVAQHIHRICREMIKAVHVSSQLSCRAQAWAGHFCSVRT